MQRATTTQNLSKVVVATLVVALFIQTTSPVFGVQASTTKSWIFTSNCDEVETLQTYVPLQKTYQPYLGDYQIVCYPSANDVMKVREYVGLMRAIYPHDKFVFVFDTRNPSIAYDFRLYMNTVEPQYDQSGTLGKSWISEGFAISALNGEVVSHELTHLTTCTVHGVGSDIDNPTTWTKVNC